MSRNKPATTLPNGVEEIERDHAAAVAGSAVPLAEHSLVRLSSRIGLEDGRSLLGGSVGAIVGIWAEGAAYMVEFADPFHAVVTVPAQDVTQAQSPKA